MAADGDDIGIIEAGRSELFTVMTMRRLGYPKDRVGEARYLVGEQPRIWANLLAAIESALAKEEDRDSIRLLCRSLKKGIDNLPQPTISQGEKDETWLVESPIPVVFPEFVERQKDAIREDGWFWLAMIVLVTASVINVRRAAREIGSSADPSGILSDPRLISGYLEVSRKNAELSDPALAARNALNQAQGIVDQQTKMSAELAGRYKNRISQIETDWQSFRDDRSAEIERLKDQVTDSIRFEATTNLWRARTREHLYWMLGSFAVMAIGIIGVIWVILARALPELEPGLFEVITRSAYPTQKLVLMTLCVVGAAWALRFVARSIVDNMSLRADAQHRQSMLDTYLALRGEVGLKDEERTIILTALFRPLPGQVADENPPTPLGEAFQKLVQR